MKLMQRSIRIILFIMILLSQFSFVSIEYVQAEDFKKLQAFVEPFFIEFNNQEVLADNDMMTLSGKKYFPLNDVLKMLNGNVNVVEDRYNVEFSLLEQRSINMSKPFPKIQIKTEAPSFLDPVNAYAAAIIENTPEHVMFSKNGHSKLYPASTTKIMTVLIALEKGDLNELVTVSQEVNKTPSDSSKAFIQPGDQLTLEQLIYATMIPSGNDAAMAVAAHISGSEKEFVKLMNQKAKEIGALNTNFVNSHGYHDPKQYTTAIDLSKIAYEASKYKQFLPFVSTPKYTTTYKQKNGKSVKRTWFSTNQQIRKETSNYSAMITGGKTGYTSASRHTLVSFAENDGNQYITVILKGDRSQRYNDTLRLLKRAIKERSKYKKTVALKYNEKSLYVNGEIVNSDDEIFSYDGRPYISEKTIGQISDELNNFLNEKTHFKRVFRDIKKGFWAREEIDYLTTKNIIYGYDDQTFRPNEKLNRLQVAVMLSRLSLPVNVKSEEREITDLSNGHKHFEAINRLVQAGYFDKLILNNEFKPYQEVNRAELAFILSNVFQLKGESKLTFSDVAKSHWAHDFIQAIAANNVTLGYPDLTFKPDEIVSRVQFSIFMARAMNDYFKPVSTELAGTEFIYWGNQSNFYKTSVETEQTITLHPYGVSQYYIVDDYIYFLSETYRHKSDQGLEPRGIIYRINKDGSNKKQLSNHIVETFGIVDDKIVYSYTGELGKNGYVVHGKRSIRSMDLDGENYKKISDISTLASRSFKEWIYFTSLSDGSKLYRMNKDGSKIEKLTDDPILNWDFSVSGNHIYYTTCGDNTLQKSIVRMNLDGTNKTISSLNGLPFTINDGYMFYNKKGVDDDLIMKSNFERSDEQILLQTNNRLLYIGETDTEIWLRDTTKEVYVRLSR